MATYNGGKYLHTQLASILSQLGENDEIIISDDGSTDDTREIIARFAAPTIRLVEGPRRRSPIANFEHALSQARGEIIFLADQDDRWLPGKVQKMVAALGRGYGCVVSDCHVTDAELTPTSESFFALSHMHRGKWYNLFVSNHYLGCCMAFTRDVLRAALPFPSEIPMHDIWIGNVAAFTSSVCFLPDALLDYRRHAHNASPTAVGSTYGPIDKFMFRFNICLPLLKRLRALRKLSNARP